MANTDRKRLLLISQVYVPDPASVGQHMHDVAVEIAGQGHSVSVIASARGYDDPNRRYPLREDREGVAIRRIPFGSLGKRSLAIRLLGQISFLLQAFLHGLLTPRIDAILVSTSPPMCSAVALAISLLRGVPIVYWVMDINPDQAIRMGIVSKRSFPARILEWLNRQILRRAHTIVTLDDFMAETLRSKTDLTGRLVVLPPWAPEGSEPVPHEENSFRLRHGLSDKFVLMYSGNHSPSHPLHTFLHAAKQLRDREDIVFAFVGGGGEKQRVEEAIAKGGHNIFSLPYQLHADLKESLSAADVHLVSVGDQMVGVVHPCKVYGAMAVARPILLAGPSKCHATNLFGFAEYACHVEHNDVVKMVRTIRELAAMPRVLRQSMGQRAREVLSLHYSKDALNGRLRRCIEAALNGQPPMSETCEARVHSRPERRAA